MRAIRTHSRDFAALLGLVAVALLAAGYIVIHQYARGTIPLLEQPPFKIKADFSNAQAVVPGQGETVRAAGVQVGKVGDVQTQGGTAIVTLAIDPKWKKKLDVRSDATALLRPRTGLKDMFVELDPGTGGRRLHDGDTIPVANTAPDVNPDEILSALDTDTRAYLQLLIGGLGKGFNGNGTSLNAVFKRLGPTQRDLGRVAGAVAQRRAALERLVHNYGRLTNTLADKDGEITRLVRSANAVFGSFAAANQQISQSVALLPGTLDQTKATLQNVNSFSRVAGPALESLRPAVRELNVANLPTVVFGHRTLIWWGTLGMMAIEGTMFAIVVVAYFYLRTRVTDWPPGLMPPAIKYGVINTAVFLASIVPNPRGAIIHPASNTG